MFVILVTLMSLALAFTYYVYKANFSECVKYSGKLGGPVAYPLIGNGLLFAGKTPTGFFQTFDMLIQQYGKCFRLWLGTKLLIVITDPKDAEILLSSTKYIEKSDEYDLVRPWLGDSLLTSKGRKWFTHRRVITPTFHYKILEQFVRIFDQQSTTFIAVLKPYADSGKSVDLFRPITLCALDVICESAMGTKLNAQLNAESEYVKAVKDITLLIQYRLFNFLIRYDFFYRFSSNRRKQQAALKVLHGYTDSVIKGRREELHRLHKEVTGGVIENELGIKNKVAFLDMLLQSTIDGQPLSDLEIRDEVATFMFAGHDTITSATSFLLQSLMKHPDVQRKAFDEIRTVVGDDRTGPITMTMLNDMHYLDLVIKETLRMFSPVPMFGRKMSENAEINGKIFPAGSNAMIMSYFMGRNPEFYPNPEKFDPERFNIETTAEKTNPYQYLPFSAGPRNCIGQKFAVLEIKSITSKLLRYYELLPPLEQYDESFTFELITRPAKGVFVLLKPRLSRENECWLRDLDNAVGTPPQHAVPDHAASVPENGRPSALRYATVPQPPYAMPPALATNEVSAIQRTEQQRQAAKQQLSHSTHAPDSSRNAARAARDDTILSDEIRPIEDRHPRETQQATVPEAILHRSPAFGASKPCHSATDTAPTLDPTIREHHISAVPRVGKQFQMVFCGADKSIIFHHYQNDVFLRDDNGSGKNTLYHMEVDNNYKHILTAYQDMNIRVYNTRNAKHTKRFKGSHSDEGSLIKVSLDLSGIYIATSCTDKTLSEYDYCSNECMARMYGHSELKTGLKFTNDCKYLISASGDGCVFIWQVPHDIIVTMQARPAQQTLRSGHQPIPRMLRPTNAVTDAILNQPPLRGPPSGTRNASGEYGSSQNDTLSFQLADPAPAAPGYRLAEVGQLPHWAKRKSSKDHSKSSVLGRNIFGVIATKPRGRWSQRGRLEEPPDPRNIVDRPLNATHTTSSDQQSGSQKDHPSPANNTPMYGHNSSSSKDIHCSNAYLSEGSSIDSSQKNRSDPGMPLLQKKLMVDAKALHSPNSDSSTKHDGDVEDISDNERTNSDHGMMYYPSASPSTPTDFNINDADTNELRKSIRRQKLEKQGLGISAQPQSAAPGIETGTGAGNSDDEDKDSTPSGNNADRSLRSSTLRRQLQEQLAANVVRLSTSRPHWFGQPVRLKTITSMRSTSAIHNNDPKTTTSNDKHIARIVEATGRKSSGIGRRHIIDFLTTLKTKYGNLFRVWVGHRLALFSTNVQYNETVLSSQKLIRKSELYKFLVPWLGNGLLLSTDQKWFNKRKILTPAFHFKILEQFIEVFDKQSHVLVDRLRPEATGKLVNIYPYVALAALDIICETAMGTSVNAQTDANSSYVKAITDLSLLLTERFVKVWQQVDFLFNLSPDKRRQDEIIKEVTMLVPFVLTFVLLFLLRYIAHDWATKKSIHISGPDPVPILGNVLMYLGQNPYDIIDFLTTLKTKYGNLFRVWVGHRLALFSTNVQYNETVLSSQKLIRKSELYKFLVPWLGNGLLLSTDQKWFNKRKILTPAFHFKILEQFIEVFDKQSHVLVDRLRPEATGKLVNIYPYVALAALDIICETAMGTSVNAQTDANSSYVKAITDLSLLLTERFVKVWQQVDFLFNLSPDKRRQDEIIKVLHDFTTKIIHSRRQELAVRGVSEADDDADIGTKRRMAFLDVLLQSTIDGCPLTDQEIQEEVDTFMFGGHDTTTIAISFTLLLLARHPEVQQKLHQEIVEIVGNDLKAPVTYRNLQDMKYLEMIIKESLRLYPPAPIIARRFTEDVDLGGTKVPEGSNFNIGIMHTHRDPSIFPDPERFDPERFAPDRLLEQTSPYAYVPFSAGPRNCIGQKFAMLELKSTLSKVIRNFKLTTAGPEPKLTMQLTLKPKDGLLFIGFVPRV
ncbi:uncharacterized protein LOC128270072 [Anopheles cruzii]|uniref:uncharacterized protein LOC128270072 n=1 Tax=Anopheles cruzii TaxID=68878 RepID=UPI0022EC3310|nr:uncharacterized protein LOC128270072 [Anopheles cruzii]